MTAKRPSHIGIVTSSFFPLIGGAERQCLKLGGFLQRADGLAWILTQQLSSESARAEIMEGMAVRRVGVVGLWRGLWPASRSTRDLHKTTYEVARERKGVRKWLNWLKQTLIQTMLAVDALVFLWRQRRAVSVVICFFFSPLEAISCWFARTLRIPVIVRSANSQEYLFQDLVAGWQKRALLAADRLVAISESIRTELLNLGVDADRIRLIPNGVDIPDATWRLDSPHAYAAVCIANLSQQPLKGLDVLIEAWARVINRLGPMRLAIGGRGDPAALSALAGRFDILEHISFAGAVKDVPALLLTADLFVLPSRVEGMSNALLEAMALGMPCVATAVSGSVDLINNGVNGILVPADNAEALAEALVKALGSPGTRASLGRAARQRIQTSYTTAIMLGRYRSVLGELDERFAGKA